jgi:ketosteroid isomerase-like protein
VAPGCAWTGISDRHQRCVADCVRAIYDALVIDELRAAVAALNDGDVEPFIALIDENSEWRGITRGHLWWKHAPS